MLNDTLKTGCQTKWKFIILLIFLAALAVGTALLLEQGQILRLAGEKLSTHGVWEPRQETAGFSYEPGGNILTTGGEEISVPCGIDALIEGADGFAVLTGGSGVLTRTLLYDHQAAFLGKIDLKDRAMLRGIFQKDVFLGLCYGKEGSWSLLKCGKDGQILSELVLETEFCYDLLGLDHGFVVETEDALLFYDHSLEPTGSYLLGSRQVMAWAAEGDLLAVVFLHQGEYVLETFFQGQHVAQSPLPMEIRDLALVQGNICILDFESLRVYDAHCNCYVVSQEGARAVCLEPDGKGLWLQGEGEAIYFTS